MGDNKMKNKFLYLWGLLILWRCTLPLLGNDIKVGELLQLLLECIIITVVCLLSYQFCKKNGFMIRLYYYFCRRPILSLVSIFLLISTVYIVNYSIERQRSKKMEIQMMIDNIARKDKRYTGDFYLVPNYNSSSNETLATDSSGKTYSTSSIEFENQVKLNKQIKESAKREVFLDKEVWKYQQKKGIYIINVILDEIFPNKISDYH